jgi:transglutaminase-like putative cysteine protease
MNPRLAVTAAVAVVFASLSLSSVIAGANWFVTGLGAVVVVAVAGILTRLSRLASAVTATVAVLIAVVPLLSWPSWAARMVGLVLVVVTALSATGARPLRGVAVLACYLAFLLLYLNLAFAHSSSFGFLIPSHSSLSALGRLWRGSFADFRYSPPIADLEPVSLVAAAGIGAVAITVDILAVRLRRPAVAGLPLLLLFSVPVASNLKVFGVPQVIIFALSLTGYLGLLAADGRERLRMWGRLVTFRHVQSPDETGSGPDTRELAASGRRIGLAAVCLAIVIPVILPTMHAHDVFASGNGGGGGGSSGDSGVSPLLRVNSLLEGKQEPVLTYTTSASDPSEQYFQVYALNYDARVNQWLPLRSADLPTAGKLPWRATGITPSTPVSNVKTDVRISREYSGPAVLPLPYAPTQVVIKDDTDGWDESAGSLMVFNNGLDMASLAYTVRSTEPSPRPANIPDEPAPPSIRAEYGSYSGPDRAELRAIAVAHTAGATTPLEKATELENWFLNNFIYSLTPRLPAGNWLPTFLTTDQRGFCSQFAQAFAVLARLIGIPSRIGVGYTGGTPVHGQGLTWQVTTADAHAWPELYFTGEGWLRFEPTPNGVRGQATAEVPVYANVGNTLTQHKINRSTSQTNPAATTLPDRRHQPSTHLDHGFESGFTPASKGAGSDPWLPIGIPAAVLLLIGWPALIRLATRRRRWLTASSDADRAHAAWQELTDDLADYGLGFARAETPRAVARRVTRDAHLDESGMQAVRRISAAEERARYARLAEPGAGLKAQVQTARRAISASVPRRQRLRARLLPASTLATARGLTQRTGELLSWLDFSWPAMRRQLRAALHRPGGHATQP